jgi:mitochondrial intermembrane space import and assembly protein 40
MASPSPSSSSTENLGSQTTAPTHESDPRTPSPPESDLNPSPQSQPEPGSEQGEGEEEEGECGFCLFMKGGGCKDAFIAWEQCVEAAEKSGENIVDKCFEVTSQLKKCMDAHADYYEPILRAEEALADSIAEEKSAEDKDKEIGKEEKEEKEKTESSE